jgi:hypothetical protein
MLKLNNKSARALLTLLALVVGTVFYVSGGVTAYAIPQFARQLGGVPCSTCHTSPPRLNETGFKFREAGWRMPEQIGKAPEQKPFKITDFTGIRLQVRYDATPFRTGPIQASEDKDFDLFAVELYGAYAPWGRYLSTATKFTYFPKPAYDTEDRFKLEGGVKATFGSEKRFFTIRGGVPHPMEGFGASDATITDTRPYIQETTANFNQNTFFTPWNFHQTAAQFAYVEGRSAIRASILSGIRLHDISDGVNTESGLRPFGRREPVTDAASQFKHNGVDVQLLANRIIHANGGSLTVYYYHGNVGLPILNPDGSIQPNRSFTDNFNRAAFYASYPVKRVTFLGGIQRGRDDIATGGRFSSLGAYTEAAVQVINDLTHAGVRLDWFDPARNKSRNELYGFTSYINLWIQDQFRFVAEYQRREQRGQLVGSNRKDNAFQLRLIFIK